MKKHVSIFLFLLVSYLSHGQITGTKYIPGDFPTIESAITALNNQETGPGGVTFLVAAGHEETFSSPTSGLITATGTADNQIIFQKSGEGHEPLITAAFQGMGSMDYIICFSGVDYITFDGISIRENVANSNATSRMEWGFALLKESGSNGSQHITIKNGSISLNPANNNTYAIYSGNHSHLSTEQLNIADFAGTNSYNKFFGLVIKNTYNAFHFSGENDESPYTFYDQHNEIGVDGENIIDGLGYTGGTVTSYGLFSKYQNNLKIAQNTFSGTVANSYGPLYVINLSTGLNSSVDVYNNTINLTYQGTGAFYGIYNAGMGASGNSNTVNIHGNQLINNSIPNYTNSVLAYIYISTGGVSANLYNNLISGNTAGSGSASANGTIYYIYINSTPVIPGTTSVYQNIISDNARVQSSYSGGVSYLLYTGGNGNVLNVMDNTINNISISSLGTTYGMYNLFSGAIKNVYNNSLTNIFNARGTTYCMYNANGSGAGYFHHNKIQNINLNAVYGRLYGIYQSSGLNQFYSNNFISELYSPAGNNNPSIYGIYLGGSTRTGAYNNTIYLDASSSGDAFGVTGIYASSTPQVELRNNLVVNNSISGAAGRIVAFQRSSSDLSSYSSQSNHNNFYAGTPGQSNFIYYAGNQIDQTLSDYKSRVSPREASSVTENTHFVNVSTSPYDLHIMPSLPSQCEGAGGTVQSPLDIYSDFDGDVRYPGEGYPQHEGVPVNAPDIGADEFGGLLHDLTAPDVIMIPLNNTSQTGNRTLSVKIGDATGVPLSGTGLPVLYWKINNGAYVPVTAAWNGGDCFSFSFGAGVLPGDIVSYYIVAQDTASPVPNVGAHPFSGACGFTTHPPACAVPPTAPFSYSIINSIAGTFAIGAGQAYPTLSSAIADLNMKEVTGPVIFELWDTIYSAQENFPLVLQAGNGTSPENTVTIKPKAGTSVKVRGASPTGILALYGTDHMIIDGSDPYNPDTRGLIFENSSTVAGSYVVGLFNDGTNGAKNNNIRNCVIKAGSKTNNTFAIVLNNLGGDFDNTFIHNNILLNATTGLQFTGTPVGVTHNGLVSGNIFGSDNNSETLGNAGIIVSNVDGLIISGNTIHNLFTNFNPTGIKIGMNSINTQIEGNTITAIKYGGTSGSGGKAIDVNTGSPSSNLSIANNIIADISGDGSNSFGSNAIAGIRLLGTSGGIGVLFNSINLEGNIYHADASADLSAAIYIGGNITGLDVRNNIFKNSIENLSGNAKAYAIYSDAPAGAFAIINYNNYYISGQEGILGYMEGNNLETLASWQATTSQDLTSLNLDPMFPSPDDLHPSNPGIDNMGLYLTSLPKDHPGDLRTNPPDMGAVEFGTNPLVITMNATDKNCENATFNAIVNANGLVVETYFDYGYDETYDNAVPGTPFAITGTDSLAISAIVPLLPETEIHYRSRVMTAEGITVYGSDKVLTTPAPGLPLITTLDASDIGSYSSTLNGLVAAGCQTTNVHFEYGLTSSYGFTISTGQGPFDGGASFPVNAVLSGLNSNTLYHYRFVGQNESGISYGEDQVFTTLLPPPSGAGAISGPEAVCQATSGHIFSIDPIDFVEDYIWTLPPGALITAGEYTETITVSFADTSASGFISVYGSGEGGDGQPSELFVSVYPLPVPVIYGSDSACLFSVFNYSTDTGMADYTWMISEGGEIIDGDGTESITVHWIDEGIQSVSVTYTSQNGCQAAMPAFSEIMVSGLPAPLIDGSNFVCENSGLYVYSTQTGQSTYIWEILSGGTIISGQGTYQVEVSWEQNGDHLITVNYANESGCFAMEPVQFEVSVQAEPEEAGPITGASKICANSYEISYSVEPIAGAVTYVWSLPAGAFIIDGEGTGEILVGYSMFAESGSITVHGMNICGEGQLSEPFPVDVVPMPPIPEVILDESFILQSSVEPGNQWYRNGDLIEGATEQFYMPEENGFYWTIVTQSGCESLESNHVEIIFTGIPEQIDAAFNIYPVPNKGKFTISIYTPKEDKVSVIIINNLGIKVYEINDIRVKDKTQLSVDLSNPPSGIYTTILKWKDQGVIRKALIVQ